MADQKIITLYPGDGAQKDIILRELPAASLQAETTIYLRQLDATPTDIVFHDPSVVPSAGGTDDLTASNLVAGVPSLGSPAIGQVHTLVAAGLSAGAPTLAAPTIGQIHALTADGLTAGTPSLDSPELTVEGASAGHGWIDLFEVEQPTKRRKVVDHDEEDIMALLAVMGPILAQSQELEVRR